ncbi:TlpA disulfide reductase family protein [Aquimarina brevivitae]|uniref:Peroxiredoxin n=1 Tax=Aquimarina brevivitae TaxID=323412 RepID=A0A4Q7P1E1_9FLAO|nr:TlpA disulfide reductase family protein [Aquimarina brevivitae]RZS93535.1 peroxiredoxin [Aquimarina brevivitae]
MKIQFLFLSLFILVAIGCKKDTSTKEYALKSGPWRATLTVQDDQELPFLFEVLEDQSIQIFNAEEVIELQDIVIKKDSVFIKFPVFEGYIAARFLDSSKLTGLFIKEELGRKVPFNAQFGLQDRFEINESPSQNITGGWQTVFSPDHKDERYIAKGIFKQNDNIVTGTFRTTTGDYRYLEGVLNKDELQLSTFDGAHAFLFKGTIKDSMITGNFYSGSHWKEPFIAKKNDEYELPDEDSLTYLKKGYEKLKFRFPNTKGDTLSFDSERFKNKVSIIQIMGTWCPNCLDESKYLANFFKENKNSDLEIVALAFEYAKTKEKAITAVEKFKNAVGIPYPVLIAQYGSSDKGKAQEKLPMLNHVLSYPTTIIVDKKGNVRKIHTGFNGPATGTKYEAFKIEFETLVKELLAE